MRFFLAEKVDISGAPRVRGGAADIAEAVLVLGTGSPVAIPCRCVYLDRPPTIAEGVCQGGAQTADPDSGKYYIDATAIISLEQSGQCGDLPEADR